MGIRISELPELIDATNDDELPIVDKTADETHKITVENLARATRYEPDNGTINLRQDGKMQVADNGISPVKLQTGIPKAVDGTTILIDANGVISSTGGGGGYEPDNTTIGLNGNSQLEVMDDGIVGNKIAEGAVSESKRTPIRDVTDLASTTPIRIGEIVRATGFTPYRYYIGHDLSSGAWIQISNEGLTFAFADLTGQIATEQIPDDSIPDAKISDVSAGKITGAIQPGQLETGIPRSVDGTTITIDGNGQISAVSSGGGYEPDGITINLNGSDQLQIVANGWIEHDGDPTGVVTPDRLGQMCWDNTNAELYISVALGATGWIHLLKASSSVTIGQIESLIYKEGYGNPNTNNETIDRLGQHYYDLNKGKLYMAVDSTNPHWKKIRN